jgi:DNA-binding LacI/PurR family transcriptional regulator
MTEAKVRTIADIACLAGVSKSTVSRALNDSPLIGDDTKARIRTIAREHRFQMNDPARRLSRKQSNVVALVTYPYRPELSVPHAFVLEIMTGISAGLHANDYDLLLIHITPRDTDWIARYLESGRVDGFILLAATCTDRQVRTLREVRAPFIIWGVSPGNHDYCTVSGDNFSGGKLATQHLLASGRRQVAFLGGPEREGEVQERRRGYDAALLDGGQRVEESRTAYAAWWSPMSAAALTRDLLERSPDLDGVFANSDLMAIAAMDEVRAQGRRVPEDVAVVGYDDIVMAAHTNPPLTTIRQNLPLAGRLLAENLLQHLRTGAVTNVSIPAELIVRQSA